MDHDRRVRESICETHLIIIQKVKKNIAPQLKTLMPCWISAVFDPNKEVAKLANEAFEVINFLFFYFDVQTFMICFILLFYFFFVDIFSSS